MAELTIDQALQQAIEAHKAGRVQEADRLYTAILKAQPKHPDANHNMGVLAVGVNKVQESLPFFKTALEANPNIAQFWISYIDTLIELGRLADAKTVLDQAKINGAKGDGFDAREKRLNEDGGKLLEAINTGPEEKQQQPNILDRLNLDQALKLAEKKAKESSMEEVKSIYQDILTKFPKNKRARGGLKALAGKPVGKVSKAQDPPQEQLQPMINLCKHGEFQQALKKISQLLKKFPNSVGLYSTQGTANKGLGKLDAAVESFSKAIALKPDYAGAHYNLGNAFRKQGKWKMAVEAYKKALAIKPGFTAAYYNMGNSLKAQMLLEEAIEAYKKALALQPDYAEAYNNLGNVYHDQGKLEEAIEFYNMALGLKSDQTEFAWNLASSAENITEAKSWVEYCLRVDPGHKEARLSLSALLFYEGSKTEFNALMQSSSKDHPYMRSFAWAFDLPELPELFFHRWALFDRMVELSKKARPFYEYGVWRGEAFRYLIKTFKKGYGFDTFEGLPEDWHDEPAGTYSSDSNIPQIKGGEFIVGKFEDTLPGFFSEPRPKASIINFDADLYSSTICALNFSKSVIDKHTILIFDEFIINKNWEQDEYKALNEFCLNNNCSYEVLAISFFSKQAAVRLIGI